MFRKMSFDKKLKNKNNIQTLAQALLSRDKTNINTGSITAPRQDKSNNEDVQNGANNLFNTGLKIGKTLRDSGLFSKGGENSILDTAINNETGGNILRLENGYLTNGLSGSQGFISSPILVSNSPSNGLGTAISSEIGGGTSSSLLGNAIGSEVGGSAASGLGEVGSGASAGGGFGGSVPWYMIAKGTKTGYNWLSNKDDTDYSDLEEGIIYPIQGAAAGASFSGGNPWATLGGALYGAGYAFKDDVGLKDNNWMTTMVFPIGMGDEHEGIIQL